MKIPNYTINKTINNLFITIEDRRQATQLADYIDNSQLFNIIEVTLPYKQNNAKIKLYTTDSTTETIQKLYDMIDTYYIDEIGKTNT